jgi:polyisoprenoid-binding protein YceI
MKVTRLLLVLLLLPLVALAAERSLKVDRARSFVDVDVGVTVGSFTARLEAYDAKLKLDDAGKIKSGVFAFKFADLKTGKPDRDAKMIQWLGGGSPTGQFEIGNLAVTPNGQGHVSGRMTFHGVTERIEFPVEVLKEGDTYTVTGETTLDYRTWNLKVLRIAVVQKVDPEVKVRFKLTGTPVVEAATK